MSAETQGRIEAGVMPITIGGVTEEFFVVGIPKTTKAVAITGLTSNVVLHEESIADAVRLAACWNACDGVKTEILEQAGTRNDWCDLMQGLEQERDQALAINAELLAALEAAVARQAYKHGGGPEWWESASAAIAKAKGGA